MKPTHLIILTLSLAALTGCQTPNAALRQQAELAVMDGEYDYAQKRLALALDQDPLDWEARYYMGLVLLEQERPLDARLQLRKAWDLRDEHEETPQIVDALARAMYEQGDHTALTAFLRNMTRRYGQPRDYLREAQYLVKLQDVDAAKVAYRKYVRLSPKDDVDARLKLADFCESVGDTPCAIDALREAYDIDHEHPVVLRRLREYGYVPK